MWIFDLFRKKSINTQSTIQNENTTKWEHPCKKLIEKYHSDVTHRFTILDGLKPKNPGWGVSREIVVDARDNMPYDVEVQYDGGIVAYSWYNSAERITYDTAIKLAAEINIDISGINKSNWEQYVVGDYSISKLKEYREIH